MSAAFHRGLTQDLRRKLQTAGIRIEEQDAQKALAGAPVARIGTAAQDTVNTITEQIWAERFNLMLAWENTHPGESPFPPIFAQVVLDTLREAILDPEMLASKATEVIKLAEAELEL